MLAIADALQEAGADVVMAGGGAGSRFVELNGYDAYEPTAVDYIDSYQGGSMRDVLTRSLPSSADRVTDYLAWLREVDPDAVVTDDMFAAFAASRVDIPLYALKHDLPALYEDPVERTGARFHTWFQLSVTREFFYPAVWPSDATDPPEATRIPPVALDDDGREAPDAPDIVLVPSHYSSFDDTAAALEDDGYDVVNVGDDDWEAVPSLLPYIRGADLVVCSGYSTIMDAAVGATPCVVVPATSEQQAVADRIERAGVTGYAVAETTAAVRDIAADPPAAPAFENGADRIAETVLDDLAAVPEGDVIPPTGTAAAGAGSSSVGEAVSTASASVVGSAATAASTTVSTALDRGSDAGGTASETAGETASAAWSLLVGRTERAAASSLSAVVIGALVAREVAVGNSYKLIEQLYPTFSSEAHALLIVAALGLVTLAAVGSLSGAGAVPSTLLASAPVVGWAVNYWAGPISPGYAVSFPIQTVLLYGVTCGLVGYLLGIRLRPLLSPERSRVRAS